MLLRRMLPTEAGGQDSYKRDRIYCGLGTYTKRTYAGGISYIKTMGYYRAAG